MKTIKLITAGLLTAAFLAAPFTSYAVDTATPTDTTAKAAAKAKPYPLSTCLVQGEKLDNPAETYAFTYKGQEIKLCCKDCRKEFDKHPAKYMKKLAAAEKKAKSDKPATK